jgi:hypothetical protein
MARKLRVLGQKRPSVVICRARVNSHQTNFRDLYISRLRVAIMALPLPPGLTPPEIAFLCEMELVTVIPRQRLEGLELLGVCVPR